MQIYPGEKPHVCSSCPKRFGYDWPLKQHEKSHIVVKCEICGKEVNGRSRHYQTHKNENQNISFYQRT